MQYLATVVVIVFLLGVWVRHAFDQAIAPQPTPVPTLTGPARDSGFHQGLRLNGIEYRIPQRYDNMNAEAKDDANRFGRTYPSGH